jgi:hypothetical protein
MMGLQNSSQFLPWQTARYGADIGLTEIYAPVAAIGFALFARKVAVSKPRYQPENNQCEHILFLPELPYLAQAFDFVG